jgi:transcriptional regulator with XRE-family HTH domain
MNGGDLRWQAKGDTVVPTTERGDMPKVNPNRTVEWERILARRIKQKREERGWTMEALAQRMTEAGCQMQKSAVAKIESPAAGERPRRISLDEAVTFAAVFGVSLTSLLVDPGVLASKEAQSLWVKHERLSERYLALQRELEEIEGRLVELFDSPESDDVYAALREYGSPARKVLLDALVREEIAKATASDSDGLTEARH